MFSQQSHPEEENVAKKGIKKVDTIVTGLILGGIVASIYGVKKIKEKNHHDAENLPLEEKHHEEKSSKKQGIFSRIFFGNK